MKATFQLRERNNNQQPLIYLAVTLRGKRTRVATGISCDKKKWVNGRPNRTQTLINQQLNELEAIVNDHLATSKVITPLTIKKTVSNWVNRETSSIASISSLINTYLEDKQKAVKPITLEKIRFDLNEFDSFKPNKEVEDLSKDLLKSYLNHIKYLPKQASTLNNYIKNLKAFLRWLWVNDFTSSDLTKYVSKFKVKDKEIVAITVEELEHLENPTDKQGNLIDITSRLERIKDVFLFGCYTGLRYSDLCRVNEDLVNDGTLVIRQQKTNNVVNIPLIREAEEILTKYDSILPTISAQKANEYLKELFTKIDLTRKVMVTRQVGIDVQDEHPQLNEIITFHVARKSFITIGLTKGIPSKMVQAISGHRKDAVFNKYIAFSDNTLKEEMKKLRSK
jgi:site-specific recombinase XerD